MKTLLKIIMSVIALAFINKNNSYSQCNDLTVNSTTYSATGLTTCGYGDDFTSSDVCSSSYMGGEDFVIQYTPTTSECISISLSNTDTWVGIFFTDLCPSDASSTCIDYTTASSGNPTLSNLTVTAGTTYFITISTFPSPDCTPFDIEIGACPPPPANDECSGAVTLTVNPDYSCSNSTSGTVEAATESSDNIGSCYGTADDDVWYSFVATGTSHSVDLLNVSGSVTDMYHSVWEGTCGSLTEVSGSCSDGDSQVLTGLTAGNTYYVRVYTYTSTSGQNTDFDICIGTPPPPPANDECSGAYSVTVNSDGTCTNTTYGTVASSTESSVSIGSCSGTADDDVWFSFVATDTDLNISIENVSGSTTDMYHSVWEGSCGSLTEVSGTCSDGDSQTLTGLTVGQTYYIRVYTWTSTSGQTSSFDVCVREIVPTVQDCAGGITVCTDDSFSGNSSGGGNYDDLDATNQGCMGSEHQSSWYYFQANTAGTIELTIETTVDYDFAIWGPYTSGTITCPPAEEPLRCSYSADDVNTGLVIGAGDNTESASGDAWVEAITANTGDTYIMVIDNFTADGTSFNFDWTLTGGASLDCTPLAVSLNEFTINKLENSNVLTWITESEVNNDFFEVQKLVDGDYVTIETIQGQGNSSETNTYFYEDYRPESKINYYRIVQVDFDGTRTEYAPKWVDNSINESAVKGRYNLMGQEVNKDYEGLVILLFEDGSTKKIIQQP